MNLPKIILRSHKGMASNMKYYVAMILIAFSIGMLYGGFSSRRLLVICPALVAALFFASLAELEITDGVLRYRRFLDWTAVKLNDVRGSGITWPGVIGYFRLHRYVLPWGRLYFVLDEPARKGATSALLAHLANHSESHGSSLSPKARLSPLRLYLAAAFGILTCLMLLYLTPQNFVQNEIPKAIKDMPTLLKTLFQVAGVTYVSGADRQHRVYGVSDGKQTKKI